MLRLGLFIYDHLGGRKLLPATKTLRSEATEWAGRCKYLRAFTGFEYSDCWVEDNQLVVLNAAMPPRGAIILPRTACTTARGAKRHLERHPARQLRPAPSGGAQRGAGQCCQAMGGPGHPDTIGIGAPGAVRLVGLTSWCAGCMTSMTAGHLPEPGRIFFAIPTRTRISPPDRHHRRRLPAILRRGGDHASRDRLSAEGGLVLFQPRPNDPRRPWWSGPIRRRALYMSNGASSAIGNHARLHMCWRWTARGTNNAAVGLWRQDHHPIAAWPRTCWPSLPGISRDRRACRRT